MEIRKAECVSGDRSGDEMENAGIESGALRDLNHAC
jgi:hypothetical protein